MCLSYFLSNPFANPIAHTYEPIIEDAKYVMLSFTARNVKGQNFPINTFQMVRASFYTNYAQKALELEDLSVGTEAIKDGAVTNSKIAFGITWDKLEVF
ncbi:MAG: hypothetical protein NZ480_04850 [Bdellovibrionaceae bacterium]|nr:hypothetical protein [Pseudobdellovibrionaceae bacterium]